ncbi:MAG TPA: YbaK/EbsC family protein [Gammaproteobacteria bacterium]|nr:YbaK/EbsC family protein [Gammaproteobacteria bacterium]
MTIAATVGDALAFEGIEFRILRTPPDTPTVDGLRSAGVKPDCCAKAQLLKDDHGYLLTVTAATRVLDMDLLCRELHRELVPAAVEDLDDLFCDCELGSVPPLGPWYRIPTVVDSSLREQTNIYFDAGEPRAWVEVTEQGFEKLLAGAEYFAFSRRAHS